MELDNLKKYSPAVARGGVGFVFLVFALWQIIYPESWIGYLPGFVYSIGISVKTLIILNGALDLLIGLGLILGVFVRISSLLGMLHLIGIVGSLGWNDVSVRDLGLLIVLISVFLNGEDRFCLGRRWK